MIFNDIDAAYHDPDPCHGVDCTATQIFGNGPRTANPPPMNGFAQDSNRHLKKYSLTTVHGSLSPSISMVDFVIQSWSSNVNV
jgi:hypothetical protein